MSLQSLTLDVLNKKRNMQLQLFEFFALCSFQIYVACSTIMNGVWCLPHKSLGIKVELAYKKICICIVFVLWYMKTTWNLRCAILAFACINIFEHCQCVFFFHVPVVSGTCMWVLFVLFVCFSPCGLCSLTSGLCKSFRFLIIFLNFLYGPLVTLAILHYSPPPFSPPYFPPICDGGVVGRAEMCDLSQSSQTGGLVLSSDITVRRTIYIMNELDTGRVVQLDKASHLKLTT